MSLRTLHIINIMDISDSVKLTAASLSDGETASGLICPSCHGGDNSDRAFAVTRNGDVGLFICYRASCGVRGAVRLTTGSFTTSNSVAKVKPPNPFYGDYTALSVGQLKTMIDLYPNIPLSYLEEVKWGIESERWLFPIHNYYGARTGYVARSFKDVPKAMTYWDVREPVMAHMAISHKTDAVVLVEDIPSAESLSGVCKIDTVALVGSHVADNLIVFLRKRGGYKNIYVALDADAWDKADKYEDRFRLLGVEALKWDSRLDPKDMSAGELTQVFGNL